MVGFREAWFIVLILFTLLCSLSTATGEDLQQEGIFIEAVSELSCGRLTLDEVRTRPITLSTSGKKFFIEADGYYIAGNDPEESRLVCEERAYADAKRVAGEQINVYIKSISETKRGKLSRDEVHTISVTVLQIQSKDVKVEVFNDGKICYHCHIQALLDEGNVFEQLNSDDKDKFNENVRHAIEIERESARLNSELAALKEKYKSASATEREGINAAIKQNEEQFEVVQWNSPGYIANYQRDFDKAIEYCYKAVEVNSKYAAAWNNLGYAYTYKGNFDRAIECYKRAIELEPQDAVSQINLGNVYYELKNFEATINAYKQALNIAPDYVNAWNSLGYVYIQLGDFDKGIEYCNKALALDKHYAAAWNGLGYAYNQKGKFYKAIISVTPAQRSIAMKILLSLTKPSLILHRMSDFTEIILPSLRKE